MIYYNYCVTFCWAPNLLSFQQWLCLEQLTTIHSQVGLLTMEQEIGGRYPCKAAFIRFCVPRIMQF